MSQTEGFDLGNQRHVQKRNKAIKSDVGQQDEALRWVMDDPKGRKFVWSLMSGGDVFKTSMGGTPELTGFNEGLRRVGAGIFNDIMRLCPQQYLKMQDEANYKAPEPKKDENDGNGTDTSA